MYVASQKNINLQKKTSHLIIDPFIWNFIIPLQLTFFLSNHLDVYELIFLRFSFLLW